MGAGGPCAARRPSAHQCRIERLGNPPDLPLGQLRKERQRDRACGYILAPREQPIETRKAIPIEAEQMDRGKIRLALNALPSELSHHAIAVDATWELDHEHEPATDAATGIRARQLEPLGTGKRSPVEAGHTHPLREHLAGAAINDISSSSERH